MMHENLCQLHVMHQGDPNQGLLGPDHDHPFITSLS
jgi:hypothetical protein